MPKPTLFISYRRGSSQILANQIGRRLKSKVKIFLDEEDVDINDKWKLVAERAIINSEYFLLILAPDTLDSKPIQFEIAIALRHSKKIIPLLTDDFSYSTATIPPELAEFKDISALTYDYRNPNDTFTKLRAILGLSASWNIWAYLLRLVGGLR